MQKTDAGGTPVERRVRPLVEHLREYADNVRLAHDGDLPNAQDAMRQSAELLEQMLTELICEREARKRWEGLALISRDLANLCTRSDDRARDLGL